MELKHEFPKDFFKEELRDGYFVDPERKRIWAVELDLLLEFADVCGKYNLRYYADGGTLLGAIRHGGFVPWDDDIDVIMMRVDYQRLCEIAPQEFHPPYFFQTEYTDPGTIRGHAQLRNSATTGILRAEADKRYPFNQGIFIDIFVLDKLPHSQKREDFFREIRDLKDQAYRFAEEHHRGNYRKREIINPFYQRMEIVCQRYNEETGLLKAGSLAYAAGRKNTLRNCADYADSVACNFEFLKIPIPIGYRNILMTSYGIWREAIRQETDHGEVIFDTEKSYIDYLKEWSGNDQSKAGRAAKI